VRCVELAICTRAARLDNLLERRFKTDLDQNYEPLVWPHARAAYSCRPIADVWDTSRLHTKALNATSSLQSGEPLLIPRRNPLALEKNVAT
jgi:hypothetical protein